VTVLEAYPEDYEERLTEMFLGAFRNLIDDDRVALLADYCLNHR